MPRMVLKGQRSDMVWSQLLQPGFYILTDADVLEVIEVEVSEGGGVFGDADHVEVTLCSLDGSTFDRTYPMDYLVPTVPRQVQEAA